MFISNSEKSYMNARIEALENRLNALTDLFFKLKEDQAKKDEPVVFFEKKRRGRTWSAEQRKKQSQIAKKYWENKRAQEQAK